MRLIICLTVTFALALVAVQGAEEQQQRILRRVIKSTPTATNLGRVRLVTIRSALAAPERGAVAEISSREAANFGQRSANETSSQQASAQQTKATANTQTTTQTSVTSSSPSILSSSTQSVAPTTQSSTPTTSSTTTEASKKERQVANKPGDRQQSSSPEVELLAGAPSSWQTMTAVEAPAAMLIASGVRSASTSDLASSSSTLHSSEELASTGDFLRSSATKGTASYTQDSTSGEAFSRVQQQQQTRSTQQQSFFYPQSTRDISKTASVKGTKTHWYQPPSTTSRPAPLIQQQEQYEQQSEQYVEQIPQIEYGAAPLGQAEPFAFDFKTQDSSGNGQYRKEESDKNGVVRGSYGYTDANGIYRHVEYVADQNGFRANIKSNEPGIQGETQPASIQLNGGQAAPTNNQRLSAQSPSENNDWISNNNNNNNLESGGSSSADLALAPPNFESAHRSDRIRSPRQYRN